MGLDVSYLDHVGYGKAASRVDAHERSAGVIGQLVLVDEVIGFEGVSTAAAAAGDSNNMSNTMQNKFNMMLLGPFRTASQYLCLKLSRFWTARFMRSLP